MDRQDIRPRQFRLVTSQITPAMVIAGALLVACSSKPTDVNIGQPGVAAGLVVMTQPPASIAARATLPAVVVQVIDGPGNPVAVSGTPVTAAIASGGGTLTGTKTRQTDANGQATFDDLAIQGRVGNRTLRFTSSPLSSVSSITVSLTPGPATALVAGSPSTQSGVLGQAPTNLPSAKVQDLDGNGVAGIGVTFAVTAGGGIGAGLSQTTGANGLATVGGWTLGGSPGTNTMTATASVALAGSPASFDVAAAATLPPFNIDLQFISTVTPTQRAAFEAARARWQQIITGDLGAVNLGTFNTGSGCGNTTITGTANDLRILVELIPYDGAGKVLGASTFCALRSTGTRLPVVGYMFFDTADLAGLESAGQLDEVVLHEMGHILGFGTLWEPLGTSWTKNFIVNLVKPPAISSLGFNGANAVSAFVNDNGGSGTSVTVEDTNVVGTGRSHWKEANFKNELMTGYLSGTTQPLSATTIGAMKDLGYTVNLAAADPFNLATAGLRAPGPPEPAPVHLDNDIVVAPLYTIDPATGRRTRIR